MSQTPPPPDARRCTAKNKKTGDRCRNYALKGLKTCRYHGSGSAKARAAGQRRHEQKLAEQRAERILRRRLGMRLDDNDPDPTQILLSLVARKAVEVEWLDEKVQQLDTDEELFWGTTKKVEGEGPDGYINQETQEAQQNIIYALLHKAQDQLAKYTSDALKAGIEERQTKVAESAGQMVAQLITQLKTRLDLDTAQEEAFDTAVVEIMQTATGATT